MKYLMLLLINLTHRLAVITQSELPRKARRG